MVELARHKLLTEEAFCEAISNMTFQQLVEKCAYPYFTDPCPQDIDEYSFEKLQKQARQGFHHIDSAFLNSVTSLMSVLGKK